MATLRTVSWWALAVGFGIGCSLNTGGLPQDGGPAPDDVGTNGGTLVTDTGVGGGSGGAPTVGSGGAPTAGSGGSLASGGSGGAANAASGGAPSSGGAPGTGGSGTGGSGTGGSGTGGSGTGGSATGGGASGGRGQTGGASALGGAGTGGARTGGAGTGGAGTGGAGTGGAASGGAAASGGSGSGGGHSGTGGRTGNCNRFPSAAAFVPSGEERAHCYWYHAELRTWPAARAQCQNEMGGEMGGDLGGDLVTIRSEEENEFVRKLARFTNSPPEVWIGATDERAGNNVMGPGTYHWVTSEAWGTYTNWNQMAPRQPDGYCDPCNSGQPCTCDHRGTLASDGTWYDFWQENARGYVCEAPAVD